MQEKLQEWLHTEHRQFFIIKDLREKHYPGGTVPMRGGFLAPTEWIEYTGKVMNAGQTGGTVAIDLMGLMGYENIKEYHTCYLKPGEAKAFICYGKR